MYKHYKFAGFEYAKAGACSVMKIFGRLVFCKAGRQYQILGIDF